MVCGRFLVLFTVVMLLFDVGAALKDLNLYKVAGKWVCLQCTYMHLR